MRPLQELGRDCMIEARSVAGAQAALQHSVWQLEQALRTLRAAMEGLPSRGTQSRLLAKPEVCEGFETLITALTSLHSLLVPLRSAAAGLMPAPHVPRRHCPGYYVGWGKRPKQAG